jgi:hypothetical protein
MFLAIIPGRPIDVTPPRSQYFYRIADISPGSRALIGHMKQSLIVFLLSTAAAFAADKAFTGEIMDSQCADMASHDNMMKGENATNAKECSIACVKKGGSYALYVRGAKQAYKLDNQKKAAAFAGQKVTVMGSIDSSGESIHVASIQAQ